MTRIHLSTPTTGTVHYRPHWLAAIFLGTREDDYTVFSDGKGHWFRWGMTGDVRLRSKLERKLEAKSRWVAEAIAMRKAMRERIEAMGVGR